MPGGDRTGPAGHGPMTGRAAGFCAGYQIPGYANIRGLGYGHRIGYGRGMGRGFGRGYWGRSRGFWWRGYSPGPYFSPAPTREEEKTYLEDTLKDLEEEINAIRERIKEISKEKKETP